MVQQVSSSSSSYFFRAYIPISKISKVALAALGVFALTYVALTLYRKKWGSGAVPGPAPQDGRNSGDDIRRQISPAPAQANQAQANQAQANQAQANQAQANQAQANQAQANQAQANQAQANQAQAPSSEEDIHHTPGFQQPSLVFGEKPITQFVDNHIKNNNDKRDRNIIVFACLNKEVRNGKTIPTLLSDRTVTTEEIGKFNIEEICQFEADRFFAIVDLITAEQACCLMDCNISPSRKMALFFFNPNFWDAFYFRLQQRFEVPIDSNVKEELDLLYKKMPRWDPDQMRDLMRKAIYFTLDRIRQNSSNSLRSNDGGIKSNWTGQNTKHLPEGLVGPLTVDFIRMLNYQLRLTYDREPYVGLRNVRDEVTDTNRNLYYLPGGKVMEALNDFVDWVNKNLEECDGGKNNPILLAAAVYQRFVSIHPFSDGNGRTGRLLADLILRRYRLPPAAWGEEGRDFEIALFPFGALRDVSSPTIAAQKLKVALERSFEIIQNDQ